MQYSSSPHVNANDWLKGASIAILLSIAAENADAFYGSGDSPRTIGVDFHSEAHINPTHFAEVATECGSGQARRSQLREELPAANQNLAASSINNRNLIEAVPSLHDDLFHVLHSVNL